MTADATSRWPLALRILAVVTGLAGAVALLAASRSSGVPLAAGLGIGALMFVAILVLTTGQDGLLS